MSDQTPTGERDRGAAGRPTLVHEFLRDAAARRPEATALITREDRVTFAELSTRAGRFAAHLQSRGLRRGDRVMIVLDNSIEAVVALFGTLRAGAVFVVVNPTTSPDKLTLLLYDCAPHTLVTQPSLAREVSLARSQSRIQPHVVWTDASDQARPDDTYLVDVLASALDPVADPGLAGDDLCAIIYTSGSTGRPKGVMLTHRNVTNTARVISTYLENTPDDVVIDFLPLAFGYGLYQVICGARVGYTVVLERSFAFPYDILKQIDRHRVTGLPGVPTVFARLLQMEPPTALDLTCLRYLTNAAAALPTAHIQRLRRFLPRARLYSMYGLTECSRVSYLPPDMLDAKIGSVGKAIPDCEALVVDDEGRPVAQGEVGELVVRGANVMRGYWGDPDRTSRRLRDGPVPGEKVLHTGDDFRMDEEGYLYFVGRRDDVFKCRGEKVSPTEVESVLFGLDDVVEAAVVGVEDEVDGMAVKAFVVLRKGASLSERELRKHCSAHLESHLVPRFFELRDELPKSGSGKLQKTDLPRSAPS